MKLPRYASQETPGVQIPTPGVPNLPGIPSSSPAYVGPIAETGVALGKYADAVQAVEQKKREITARAEAARIQATVGLNLKTFKLKLDRTENDPDSYGQQWDAYKKDTISEAYKQAPNAETLHLLQVHLPQIEAEVGVAAQESVNKKYVSGIEAKTSRTESMYKQSVSTEDFRESGWANWFAGFQRTVTTWEENSEVRGKEATEKEVKRTFNDFYDARVRQHILEDPDGFLVAVEVGMYSRQDPIEKGGRYWGMDPEKRTTAIKAAEAEIRERANRVEQYEKDKEQTAHQEVQKYHEAAKEAQQAVVGSLQSDILAGKDIDARLQDPSTQRALGEKQISVKRDAVWFATDGRKEVDDWIVVNQFDAMIDRPQSSIQVDDILRARGLSPETKTRMMNTVRSVREAARTREGQEWAQEYSLAMADLSDEFKTETSRRPSDKVSIAVMESVTKQELRNRTIREKQPDGSYTAKERPVLVARELISRMTPAMEEKRAQAAADLAAQLPGRYKPPAGKYILQTDLQQGRIDEDTARGYARTLRLWDAASEAEKKRAADVKPTTPKKPGQ